jgi:hypothetical protein
MSSNYRLCSRSTSGRGGKRYIKLVAELALALLLEEFELGGGANVESFSMVSEGVGGQCIPVATTIFSGAGGGNQDRKSSASPNLGQRGDSSSPALGAGSRQSKASPTVYWLVHSKGSSSC